MPARKIQRLTNLRKLTPEKAAEARNLREVVEKDKDDIIAAGRRLLAEKHSSNRQRS